MPQLNISTRTDLKLAGFVASLFLIELIILLAWQHADPLQPTNSLFEQVHSRQPLLDC